MAPIKVAFYDAKGYDRTSFEDALKADHDLKNQFDFQFYELRLDTTTASFAQGCDAVCAFVNDDLGADVLAILDEMDIRLVLMRCAGFDRVDLKAAEALEISVARVPAYSPYAVAEFAVALLQTLNRKTHRAFNRIRDGNFTLSGFVGFDIHGKTVGVIGTGKIGQCFIDIMLGFGCDVLAYDVFQADAVKAKPRCRYVELDELFEKSDIISLHAPLTKETTHLINKNTINKMKIGAYIINTSRGKLIDAKALIDGLMTQRLGGAGLDVYENEADYFFRDVSNEDIADDLLSRLTNMRTAIVTSHQAFLTNEALSAIAKTTLLNLREFFIDRKRLSAMTNAVAPPPEPPALIRALSRRSSQDMSRKGSGSSSDEKKSS